MDVGSIADTSMLMSYMDTRQTAGTYVLKQAMNTQEEQGSSLIRCMQDSAVPPSGRILDRLV